VLRGDVDGDGSTDRVFVTVAGQAAARCRYLPVVALDGRRLVAPITHRWYSRARSSFVKRYLQLDSLIALTPRGLDIVVNVDRGATTDSIAIFALEGRNLRRRLLAEPGSEHLVLHGGSVTHQHGVDCKRPRSGMLLVSGGAPLGNSWQVERRLYRALPAGPLQLVATTRQRVRDFEAAVGRFPELGTAFRSCTAAGRR
jgi:hypothetical protein